MDPDDISAAFIRKLDEGTDDVASQAAKVGASFIRKQMLKDSFLSQTMSATPISRNIIAKHTYEDLHTSYTIELGDAPGEYWVEISQTLHGITLEDTMNVRFALPPAASAPDVTDMSAWGDIVTYCKEEQDYVQLQVECLAGPIKKAINDAFKDLSTHWFFAGR